MTTADLGGLRSGAQALGVSLDDAQVEHFRRYAHGLAVWNARLNLTSARALADIERTHFLDSLTLAPLVTREVGGDARVVDVGAGAGFPGVALKLAMPSLRLTLIEATAKKAEFLRWLAGDLALDGVEVLTGRAEMLAHDAELREAFDVATARALGPLTVVLELTLPFVRAGGVLLAQRGSEGAAEAEAAGAAAEALGGAIREAHAIDGGERCVVVVDKRTPTPERYPRRVGVPAKRPLA